MTSRDHPIIVGGCHRSGTSLVRRILNSHSRIYCGPEVKFFRDFYNDYLNDPVRNLRFATTARAMLPEDELFEVLGRAFITVHERAAALAEKPRWADKNPENVLYLEEWQRLLGDEWTFVHVVRNPLDTLASMKEARFPATIPPDLDGRIRFYRRYTQAGLEFESLHPERYYRVIYDELVQQPETIISALMDRLGEDFEPVQVDFNKHSHQRGMEDRKVVGTTEVHADSVGRWREMLTPAEAAQISRDCEDLWRAISGDSDRGSRQPMRRLWHRLGSWTSGRGQTSEQEGEAPSTVRQPGPRAERGSLTPSPFIVGVARSGTTLLRLMLDAHPDLAIPPETHFISEAVQACEGAPDPRRAFLESATSHRVWEDYGVEKDLLAQRIAAIEPFDVGEALRAFYELYAERLGKPRWGDKTPTHLRRMKLIQRLLPEARFIHVIRDGRDVALSVKDLWFGPNSVEEAAQRWQTMIERARRQARDLPHYLEVRYEDLVTNTDATLRKIGDFVDLPWNPIMLDYYKTAEERISESDRDVVAADGESVVRGETRQAIHSLTGKPPQSDRIGRWRQEMDAIDRSRFEEIAGETLRDLGYEVG